jgi:ketosteroid isomerase-like protein
MVLCFVLASAGSAQATRYLASTAALPASGGPAAEDNLTKVKELVQREAEAWEKQDFEIAAGDWLADGELISPGGHLHKKDLPKAMADYFVGFRDAHITIKNIFISPDGNKAAIEWDWDITRKRDGARAVSRDAIIVDLVGGKIASWREYFDLGGSIEAKP